MKRLEHPYYLDDLDYVSKLPVCRKHLQGKTFFIAGASGMIGTFLVDTLMYCNKKYQDNCRVIACVRNKENAIERFLDYERNTNFELIFADINIGVPFDCGRIDYIVHGASNTHPLDYAGKPIETIMTNVLGTRNLLELAVKKEICRFLFLSSVEIYGEEYNEQMEFKESDCGYIDCNTLRAGYPESKRVGEALCQAYGAEKNLDFAILRLARTYGATMKVDDSKALSQFVMKAVAEEDIVLKSEGKQYYSYIYVADAVSALLTVLFQGNSQEAYNAAGEKSRITLYDLAALVARIAGKKVIFQLPEEKEYQGYSRANRAILNTQKLKTLRWKERNEIDVNLDRTVVMLKGMKTYK